MAARRGRTQARRNQGNDGLPGWAWMVLGIVLTIAAIAVVPRLLKSDGDGFFRPQPNPDAQPAPVASGGDEVAPVRPNAAEEPAANGEGSPKYDFYTLLPGKEVAVSDAELAATERAEAARAAALLRGEHPAPVAAINPDAANPALPMPVNPEPGSDTTAPTPPSATRPEPVVASAPATPPASGPSLGDGSRYLLQAGAFRGASQADELKARIAMVGLSARVEPAQINGQTVYRVRMGPYDSAGDLADAKRKLGNSGLPAMAIKVK